MLRSYSPAHTESAGALVWWHIDHANGHGSGFLPGTNAGHRTAPHPWVSELQPVTLAAGVVAFTPVAEPLAEPKG